jgi:SSS family solute:Na+ symporter
MKHISIIDISIVVAYLLVCLVLGFKKFGQVKTLRDYTFGSKPLSTIVLTATTFATIISASQLIGNVGKSYQLGIVYVAAIFFSPIGWFILSRLMARNLSLFQKKQFLTLGDIMEYFYGRLGQRLSSYGSIFISLGVIAAGSMGIGKLVYHFFAIPELVGIIVALGVVTIYSTLGGFRAVAITDVFQFAVFFIAIPVACAIGYHNVGGYKNILQSLPPSHLTIEFKDLGLFLGVAIFCTIPAMDIPYIQRAMASKNQYQLRKAFNSTGLLMIPLIGLVALMGFITYVKNPNLQTDTVLFYFMEHYLPVGALGLMIAGLLAVIMSTQDSYLNTTSILISSDICKKVWPNLNAKEELLIARVSCVVLSIASISLVYVKEDIVSLIWFISNFWDPFVGIPFLLALAGVRVQKKLFFIIPTVSFIALMAARQIIGEFDIKTLTLGMAASAVATLILSSIKKAQHEAIEH